MARPVVSTSLGAEGLDVVDGQSILLADDAESFATKIDALLTSPDLASIIGGNGHVHAVANYDWNKIGERLECVLSKELGLIPRRARVAFHHAELNARTQAVKLGAA